jgi:hypothetical protein
MKLPLEVVVVTEVDEVEAAAAEAEVEETVTIVLHPTLVLAEVVEEIATTIALQEPEDTEVVVMVVMVTTATEVGTGTEGIQAVATPGSRRL